MTVSGVPKPSQWYTYAAIDKKKNNIFFQFSPPLSIKWIYSWLPQQRDRLMLWLISHKFACTQLLYSGTSVVITTGM